MFWNFDVSLWCSTFFFFWCISLEHYLNSYYDNSVTLLTITVSLNSHQSPETGHHLLPCTVHHCTASSLPVAPHYSGGCVAVTPVGDGLSCSTAPRVAPLDSWPHSVVGKSSHSPSPPTPAGFAHGRITVWALRRLQTVLCIHRLIFRLHLRNFQSLVNDQKYYSLTSV